MRYALVAAVLLAGCSQEAASTLPPVSWQQWRSFGDFEAEVHAETAGLTWDQAEQSCNALGVGVHLPTQLQWDVMRAAGFDGIDRPVIEWFWSKTAAPTWYDAAIDTYFFDPPSDDQQIAFRCVR